jgi:hypothetical protein
MYLNAWEARQGEAGMLWDSESGVLCKPKSNGNCSNAINLRDVIHLSVNQMNADSLFSWVSKFQVICDEPRKILVKKTNLYAGKQTANLET